MEAAAIDVTALFGFDSPPPVLAAAPRAARQQPRFELRCSTCAYGVVVRVAPASCPMCGGSAWEHPPRAVPVLG